MVFKFGRLYECILACTSCFCFRAKLVAGRHIVPLASPAGPIVVVGGHAMDFPPSSRRRHPVAMRCPVVMKGSTDHFRGVCAKNDCKRSFDGSSLPKSTKTPHPCFDGATRINRLASLETFVLCYVWPRGSGASVPGRSRRSNAGQGRGQWAASSANLALIRPSPFDLPVFFDADCMSSGGQPFIRYLWHAPARERRHPHITIVAWRAAHTMQIRVQGRHPGSFCRPIFHSCVLPKLGMGYKAWPKRGGRALASCC